MDPDPLPFFAILCAFLLTWGATFVEAAFALVDRAHIRSLSETGHSSALVARDLLADDQRVFVVFKIVRGLGMVLIGASVVLLWSDAESWLWLLAILGVVLLAVLGDLVSRSIAIVYSNAIVLNSAVLLNAIRWMLQPVSTLFSVISSRIYRSGSAAFPQEPALVAQELRQFLGHYADEREIQEVEKQMIVNILDMEDMVVREIMVPRIDMITIDVDTPLQEALDTIIDAGYSRIPVYEQSPDRIVGVLYAKDLLNCFRKHESDIPIRLLLRPTHFVPVSKRVNELLQELQKKRVHIAIVVDEYGGTAGLVTIEDLLEEIVGDIRDEYDTEADVLVQPIGPQTYLMNPRLNIDDLAELLAIGVDDQSSTLGGLLYTLAGRVPGQGETVQTAGWRFTILSVDGHRIEQVRVEPASLSDLDAGLYPAHEQGQHRRSSVLNLSAPRTEV